MESMSDQKEYIIRTQSDVAYTYGLGEVVIPGVALFKSTETHLTHDELNAKLKQLGKVVLR
jgi:hypothetical protein